MLKKIAHHPTRRIMGALGAPKLPPSTPGSTELKLPKFRSRVMSSHPEPETLKHKLGFRGLSFRV